MRNVLVPTDFSEASVNALIFGLNLYKNTDTIFNIIHIYQPTFEPIQHEITDSSLGMEKVKENNMSIMLKSVEKLAKNCNVKISSKLDIGFTIERLAKLSVNYDLIIMGFTGANNFLSKVFGGISYGVVSKSKCPVLLIPEKRVFAEMRNIIFTADFENLAENVFSRVLDFAKRNNSKIHFLHIENENKDFIIDLKEIIPYTFDTINS
jgi:nucleotide-binding universal stress UspA family protein